MTFRLTNTFYMSTVQVYFCYGLLSTVRLLELELYRPYWMEYTLLAVGLVPLLLIPILVGLCQLCRRRRGYTYFTQVNPDSQIHLNVHHSEQFKNF